MPHDIWDLHAESGRWWIVTNPTNLYSQEDFESRDVVLTFHVGLALRMMSREEEMAARLAEPCSPSSDISTYLTPERFGQRP